MLNDQETAEEEEPSENGFVLVVDDDAAIGELIVEALKSEGSYRAAFVPDGFQALKFIRDIKPDLFLLDYQLPRMDGLELYDQLSTIENVKQVPVLFISASSSFNALKKRQLHYIEKPFELDELLNSVKRLLG